MATYSEFIYSDDFKTELPSHWQEKRLGFLAEQTKNAFVDGPFGSDLKSEDYLDEGVPLIQLNNIRDGKHILRNMKFISDNKKQDLIRHLALPQDIVIAKMAEPVARAAVVSEEYDEYVIVADCVKLTPNLKLVDLNFLIWAINSDCVRENAELVSTGTTRIRINLGELKKLKVPYPSLSEQIKIREYLDHETAQIDSLIAKQEKLIELLKEKRQAVISHAVTKGLNPDVAMKNSAVEWLGNVPEHWKVMQFRRITSLSQGLQIPQSERLHEPNDNTVEYITIKSLNAKDDAYKEYIYKASDRVTCGKSDVLLARTGATGEVVTNVSGAFHNNFFKVSYSNDILRDFLVYILKVKELKSHLLMLAGTTTIPDLNHGAFLGTQIALPSLTEQQEIIDFIDDYLRRSMILEGKARSAIQLMQERRTALISSAVTGKIDVRNWQNPNEAKTEFSA